VPRAIRDRCTSNRDSVCRSRPDRTVYCTSPSAKRSTAEPNRFCDARAPRARTDCTPASRVARRRMRDDSLKLSAWSTMAEVTTTVTPGIYRSRPPQSSTAVVHRSRPPRLCADGLTRDDARAPVSAHRPPGRARSPAASRTPPRAWPPASHLAACRSRPHDPRASARSDRRNAPPV
jgi:hypothetical protein